MNRESFEAYLRDGCGRCEHYRTPACKVHRWTAPLQALRDLLLGAGLTESMKWGSPCYTVLEKNVVLLVSFKEHCALSFLKGAALVDDEGQLQSPGPNSRFARYLKFQTLEEVQSRRDLVCRLLDQAIALEQSGTKVVPSAPLEPIPDELRARLEVDPPLADAFEALTPGRRRSHILHITGAKQAATRERRVERCAQDILAGRGFNER